MKAKDATMPALAGQQVTLAPKDTASLVAHCINIGQPVIVLGTHGIGKSSVIDQVGDSTTRRLIDVRGSLLDSVDVNGLPTVTADNKVSFARPWFLPDENDTAPTLLFLDEINRAVPMVQNALFQLVLDRKVGQHKLPATCAVAAAGNYKGVGVQKMDDALSTRFLRINMVVSAPDWLAWARANLTGPGAAITLSYIEMHPQALCPDDDAMARPRTYEFVARSLCTSLGSTVERALIAGSIGEAQLPAFWAHVTMFRALAANYNIADLLAAPSTYRVPDSVSVAYALTNALSLYANPTNFAAIVTYLDRLPQEYAVFSVNSAIRRDPTLKETRAYTQWCLSHQSALT